VHLAYGREHGAVLPIPNPEVDLGTVGLEVLEQPLVPGVGALRHLFELTHHPLLAARRQRIP
jgi:hypothetical protein